MDQKNGMRQSERERESLVNAQRGKRMIKSLITTMEQILFVTLTKNFDQASFFGPVVSDDVLNTKRCRSRVTPLFAQASLFSNIY